MRINIVRQLLLASSGAKHNWVQCGQSTRQLQRRSLQLAVLRGNDNYDKSQCATEGFTSRCRWYSHLAIGACGSGK